MIANRPVAACIAFFLGLALLTAPAVAQTPDYVGSSTCGTCHQEQMAAWQGSHHADAWKLPNKDSVLGDFDDSAFEHRGVTTRFTKTSDEYFIETEGPDGVTRPYKVLGTIGVAPLQQYIVETEPGSLQAVDVVWDDQRKRWYHLYPDQNLPAGDGLHWTGPYKNYNSHCAECHATGFKKGYDAQEKRYHSRQAEIGVGCESCHGPGEAHIAWVRDATAYAGKEWENLNDKGLTIGFAAESPTAEIEQCAPCHSRRASFTTTTPTPGAAFHDNYRLSMLRRGLYFPDGQILDEVYVYGSFLQSKMYANGVRCSDCHDPHRAALKAETGAVCAQCHNPAGNPRFSSLRKADYTDPAHHFHAGNQVSCADCHMPERVYMGIDGRRDHSFRIPRPDVSERLGTPNACTSCHTDKPASWATAELARRFGPRDPNKPGFPATFHAVNTGAGDAASLLIVAFDEGLPAIIRATALENLLFVQSRTDVASAVVELLNHPDPLIRVQAVALQRRAPPQDRVVRLLPRLEDETRIVRMETARTLLGAPVAQYPKKSREPLERARSEYQASLEATADFPETQMALGGVALTLRNLEAAETAFLEAVRLDPQLTRAWSMVARIQEARGAPQEARETVTKALAANPGAADLMELQKSLPR